MDTIIKKLLLSLFCAMPLITFGATDDDIDAVFMTVALNNGQSESIMLSNNSENIGPMFHPAGKTLTINGTSYNSDDVKEIRFDIRQVDAIQDIELIRNHITNGIIYNLNGQVVGRIGTSEDTQTPNQPSMEGLPKGIYIVNSRKIIIR